MRNPFDDDYDNDPSRLELAMFTVVILIVLAFTGIGLVSVINSVVGRFF